VLTVIASSFGSQAERATMPVVYTGMYIGERFNSISHLIGAALALAGSVVLVTFAAMDGDTRKILSYSVYGFTLFLLYLFSTLYHAFDGPAKGVLRVLDHQAIYLLIAGTYTPFTLVALRGALGWWMFGAIWGLAVLGIILDALPRKGPRVVPIIIYLVMGWLCLLALDPLLATLPPAGFRWLLAGGIFYTSGILFFVLDHWHPWCHGIWHLFVLAGSVCHYFTILLFL
jgi:hemolysin III